MKKSSIDQKQLIASAIKLRAIAHPMRIAIVNLLEEHKKLNVTQIHTKMKIEQATASHHLGLLKTNGILNSKKNGKEIIYSIKEGSLKKLADCIDACSF